MIKGLCSVIMPAYNAGKYIREAIESVLTQSYKNLELIVIEDNSSDCTKSIVSEYAMKDARIIVYFNEEKCGCAGSRNIGLSLCHGEYVAFIDSDDVWLPEKLELQINYLKDYKKDMIFTAYEIINSDGCLLKRRSSKEKLVFKDLLKENSVIFSTTCFRYECIKGLAFKQEWFHEDYVYLLDYLRRNSAIHGLNKNCARYRVHVRGRSFNKLRAAKFRWKIYRDYLKLSVLTSAYYFSIYAIRGLVKYI